ncbi:MAG: exopolysaccharide Pel transporter PelG [Gammaproteobacteria bacterium]|nr:exopolysaccharide Pel transporter PelG [Gammaproteobacteria bacterium]
MAGVGFVLQKLSQRGDFAGNMMAFFYSAIISSGPWLFTVVCLAVLVLVGNQYLLGEDIAEFRIIIIYNFSFSLVLSAPVIMIVTRYLSDMIYAEDVSGAPGALVGMLVFTYCMAVPVAILFYFFYAQLDVGIKVAAILNFILITGIWLANVFLSAMKEYASLARSFGIGMFVALCAAIYLSKEFAIAGMLFGFNIGLAFIFFDVVARILSEYPGEVRQPFSFIRYFKTHWEVALSGLIYNLAVWVDKWVMWSSQGSTMQPNGLISFPHYDGAMFLAYLSIVPAIALFTFSVETKFFEAYLRFYQDIKHHATYERIEHNATVLWQTVLGSARGVLVLQLTIAIILLILAPLILSFLQSSPMQLGIFRYGVLGSVFHALTMFITAMLSYFDARLKLLFISVVFFVLNTSLTMLSLEMGQAWYGWGYTAASIGSFSVAFLIFAHHLKQLPFETFVANNASVN